MSGVLLTVDEAAARLKCHPHTVRRWIWGNKLKAVKVGDLVRIPEDEVTRFAMPTPGRASGRKTGAKALLKTMQRLKKTVNQRDVMRAEASIREAKQLVDWNNPLE